MGLFNWGALPKAQDNAQTIDEAIAAAIVAHEEDPTAHLGDGESLQQHKSNEIIDHLAGSIVPDKINSFKKFNFPSMNAANVASADYCSVYSDPIFIGISQASPITFEGYADLFTVYPADLSYVSGDLIVDFGIYAGGASGTWQSRFDFSFAGVEIKAGYYRLRYFNGTWQTSAWISQSLTANLNFRIFYSAINDALYFYLNGVLVYTVNGNIIMESDVVDFFLYTKRNTSNDCFVQLYNLSYYLEPTI